jgi:hypothetical protein
MIGNTEISDSLAALCIKRIEVVNNEIQNRYFTLTCFRSMPISSKITNPEQLKTPFETCVSRYNILHDP